MKTIRILYFTVLLLGVSLFSSCEKDEIGGTAMEKMAGDWYVTVVAVDADNNLLYSDDELFELGNFHLSTYNLSSNASDTMWIYDNDNLYFNSSNDWSFQLKVPCIINDLTFGSSTDTLYNYIGHLDAIITEGKILKDAATTPIGMPADSIVFYIKYDGDPYAAYDVSQYKVSGYRYTGFALDN